MQIDASASDFIERQFKFQILGVESRFTSFDNDVVTLACQRRRSRYAYDRDANVVLPVNEGDQLFAFRNDRWARGDGPHYVERTASVFSDIYATSTRGLYMADMRDARPTIGYSGVEEQYPLVPFFQHNRLIGGHGQILWPLAGWHDAGGRAFPGQDFVDPVPFEAKLPRIIWRGGPNNSVRRTFEGQHSADSLDQLARSYLTGKLTSDEFRSHREKFVRLNAVIYASDMPMLDCKFTLPKGVTDASDGVSLDLFANPMPPKDQCLYKYILSLPGNDWSSSFYWSLASKSVVMRATGDYESFVDCHFSPWAHFIPVADDLSDIAEKLDWAESNPDACRQMVSDANAMMKLVLHDEIRRAALGEVIRWYETLF